MRSPTNRVASRGGVSDDLSTDDFLSINAAGQAIDKQSIFRVLASLPYQLAEVVDDAIQVRRYGPFAIVTARETVKGRASAGPVVGQLRLYQVWVKRGSRWQTVGGQGALMPSPPPN